MEKHTQGPWTIRQEGDDYVVKGAPGTTRVLSIRTGVIPMPNDARLIAAAPSMLDIIRALVSSPAMVDNDEPMMNEARAILRDVEGQS